MHSWNKTSSPSLDELFNLDGKVALVTGAAGILGSQIAAALAEQGATIVAASRNLENCQQLAKDFSAEYGGKHYALKLDITDTDSVKACIDGVIERSGKLDILVNCSWTGAKNTWDTITEEDWLFDIDMCLNGVFRCVKAAYPHLKKTKGVILNVASMYGHVAPDYRLYEGKETANPASYGAGKAGVIQFTKYLASFLSPHDIRANCISPGPFPYESLQRDDPRFAQRLADKNTRKRVGKPYEMKGAAALLCSDASSYINGQNICVDGGWAIW
ncbi:MAG TPA: SDR family oxidoreductase [Rhizobiales bacterium]|nr:SDR family oxidoreductase [Hyphomicrobiales bacterium]